MKRLATLLTVSLCAVPTCVAPAWANEIDFVEDFALAKDRAVPLAQLIPGTEPYYYYHCLHLQNTGRWGEVEDMVRLWVKRSGHTGLVNQILNRQALLTYPQNHAKTLEFLRNRLGLHFNHQRERLGAKPELPSKLDPARISRQTLTHQAMSNYRNTDGFEDSALDWLIDMPLDADRRRHLLSRLRRPDYDQLPKLIVEDLRARHSRGFGALPIHRQLLLSQLEDLLGRDGALLNQTQFVNTYLTKLRPSPDVDWRGDAKQTEAYLDRLWSFVSRLQPVHNSLKAHVLYHRLVFDRSQGIWDADRFEAYLKLPRSVSYANSDYLNRREHRRFRANLNSSFATLLPNVGNDEPLVRSFLLRFFVEAKSTRRYTAYVNDTYLNHLFAEAKILAGVGDMEQWYSMLPPAKVKALKDRVDIDFAYTRTQRFDADEDVSLEMSVKNVKTLIVKVYELNARNYYREHQREVNTDINLDGLVANFETTHTYTEPPLRRITRRFDFPQLKQPGTYVVDFIGNGQSSRALVRKGSLRYHVRTGAAGHVVSVIDEANRAQPKATLWLGGREYTADADGTLTVPFSNSPGRQRIVLASGRRVSLDWLTQSAEAYALQAGFHVDRESLLKGRQATVTVRAGLTVAGTPVSLKVLEAVRLVIHSTDLDGVASTQEIAGFELFEDREAQHTFKVPDRLASLRFELHAKVKNLSQGKTIDLSQGDTVSLNGIDVSAQVDDAHIAKVRGGYVVEIRGKTGELRPNLPWRVTLKHRDFRQTVHAALQTNGAGRTALGRLDDIAWIQIDREGLQSHRVEIRGDRRRYAGSIHAAAGETIDVPFMATSPKDLREGYSLLEVRDGSFVRDWFQSAKLDASRGLLTLSGLPGGDYDLFLKRAGKHIAIRVAKGEVRGEQILGAARQLETRGQTPLQIGSVKVDDKALTVRLSGTSPHSRVHVIATRYVPAFPAFERLARVGDRDPERATLGFTPSIYLSGRNIGDEFRYIIDRQYAKKYAGNMLKRPPVLLNPWAIRATEAGTQDAQGGERWGYGSEGAAGGRRGGVGGRPGGGARSEFSNIDFLAKTSVVLLNLAPDKNGVVTVPREELGAHQHVHVVAVDAEDTVARSVSLADPKVEKAFRDLRLTRGLDPKAHYTERRQATVVREGKSFAMQDITTSSFEAYDSLAKVYRLYVTLSGDAKLQEFSFLLRWPKMKFAEKCTQYSKYASHELNYFIFRKDPAFFREVVQPYLRNKKDKTFLDRYLCGEDLSDQLEPWAYGRLNVVERILLARRLGGEETRAAKRHVGDMYDVLPPNPEHLQHLFRTALKSSALDTGDAFGLGRAMEEAAPEAMLKTRLAERKMDGFAPGDEGVAMDEEESDMDDAPAPSAAPMEAPAAPKPARNGRRDAKKKLAKELGRQRAGKDSGRWRDERSKREAVRQLYRKLDKTKEWVENNYYELPIEQQVASLITVNAFWRDFAAHDKAQAFHTVNLAEASRNFPEMMFALSALDLPFESTEHETEFAGAKMAIKTGGPVVFFHKQILPAQGEQDKTPILISQNVFRYGDRFRMVNGERVDKFVRDEFLVHTVYGVQVVVTNPTSSRQKLDILLQIPRGAIPVLNGRATRSVHVTLEPYRTHSLVYQFYFPFVGEWPQYPVHVAKAERLVASAAPMTFKVVDTPSNVDKGSWDYVSQQGTDAEVFAYLEANNLQETPLNRIAWRVKDRAFFLRVIEVLSARHLYDDTLWSYGLKHDVAPVAQQFLQHADGFVRQCGEALTSELLTIDPVVRHAYQHMEYAPLVNARAHTLGRRRQILNGRFSQQYTRLLNLLKTRKELDAEDLLDVTYYMLLQDRVEEALGYFARVDRKAVPTQIQYDYFQAYLAVSLEDVKRARAVCEPYAKHPVDRWRALFAAVTSQLDEIEGKAPTVTDPEDRDQTQGQLAGTEASFELGVEAKQVTLDYQNVASAQVNYYLMDVELLFSRNPFVQQVSGQFSFIRPNATEVKELPEGKSQVRFALPEQFHNSNVLVEVVAGGKTRSVPYYSNSLGVQVIESYGQVRVTDAASRKALSKVYVKVYAEMQDGSVRFYKDGYTDLRGRFDYTSLNTNELDFVKRFSLLVLSDSQGAVVKKAQPPQR